MSAALHLVISALAVYGIVFLLHLLRHRLTQAPFFAFLGALAAVTVWVTDTATRVNYGDLTFLYGSVVFFMAMLLGVFLAYAFDGTHSGQVAIVSVVAITILTPLFALLTRFQGMMPGTTIAVEIPLPSARVYAFSAGAMLVDFTLMAIIWQGLINWGRSIPLVVRVFLTILAALWADTLIFTTGAFGADPDYLRILMANFLSRSVTALLVAPVVAAYMAMEVRRTNVVFPRRPVLAILRRSSAMEKELSAAQQEVRRRKEAEKELEKQLTLRNTLLAAIPYPVYYKDGEGRFLGVNEPFEALTGLKAEEVAGKTARDIWPPQSPFQGVRLPAGSNTLRAEIHLHDASGQAREVILSKSAFTDANGQRAGLVGIMVDITEMKELERRLFTLATHDALTGILNRRSFLERLGHEFTLAREFGHSLSLIMVDADKFKDINDRHGHAVGDQTLARIGEACRAHHVEGGAVGRLGGEEFAILLPNIGREESHLKAERLRQAIADGCTDFRGRQVRCTVSVGVATLRPSDQEAEDFLHRADLRMYKAKRDGGNRTETDAETPGGA